MTGKRVTWRTARVAGEERVLIELVRQVAVPGGTTRIAREAGVSVAMISQVASGAHPMTVRVATAMGYQLRYERVQEQDRAAGGISSAARGAAATAPGAGGAVGAPSCLSGASHSSIEQERTASIPCVAVPGAAPTASGAGADSRSGAHSSPAVAHG